MLGLGSLSARFPRATSASAALPPPPAAVAPNHTRPVERAAQMVAAALLPFSRDWRKTMQDVEQKIVAAQDRRAALVAERDALVIAAVEGDDAARADADKLDRQLDDVDRELSRLSIARQKTKERIDSEAVAEREKLARKHAEDVKGQLAAWREKATEIDEKTAALAAALTEFNRIGVELRRMIGESSESSWLYGKMAASIPNLVNNVLGGTGYHFERLSSAVTDSSVASRVPAEDYVLRLLQKANG